MTRRNTLEDFWRYIEKTDTCWLCRATNTQGYGIFHAGRRRYAAHRLSYELLVGPIPDGLVIDHLCRVRNCVNPDHLEPVTPRTNTLRSPVVPAAINSRLTHCANGHELSADNTWPCNAKKGGRSCRLCDVTKRATPKQCPECGKTTRADTFRRHALTQHGVVLAGLSDSEVAA